MSATHRLIIIAGGPKRAAYLLAEASIGIGRDADNVIQVEDNFVSRHHAVLVRNCDGYILRDLGSRNSTFVNDLPVLEIALKPGDRLRFGGFEFQYEPIPATESPDAGRLVELTQQHAVLTRAIAGVREELATHQQQAAERGVRADADRTQLTTELAAVREQLDEQRHQHAEKEIALQAEVGKSNAERDRLTAQLAQTRQTLADLSPVVGRVEELDQTIAILSDEMAEAQAALASARNQLAERDAEFERWQNAVTDVARCVRHLLSKFAGLTATRNLTASERRELIVRLNRVTAQLADAQRQMPARQKVSVECEERHRDVRQVASTAEPPSGLVDEVSVGTGQDIQAGDAELASAGA